MINWCCCWKLGTLDNLLISDIAELLNSCRLESCRYCWHIAGKAGDVPGDRVFANIADMLTDSSSVPRICPQKGKIQTNLPHIKKYYKVSFLRYVYFSSSVCTQALMLWPSLYFPLCLWQCLYFLYLYAFLCIFFPGGASRACLTVRFTVKESLSWGTK